MYYNILINKEIFIEVGKIFIIFKFIIKFRKINEVFLVFSIVFVILEVFNMFY